MGRLGLGSGFVAGLWLLGLLDGGALEPCQVAVVEEESGWPVPLVELRTTHGVRMVSDNAGLIAVDQPELMGVETWFWVDGHGYEVPRDGFGMRGVRLTPEEGGQLTVRVKRMLPGRRLGRLTGAGIFAESQKLGEALDWAEQGVMGCDSVQTAVHGGRMMWLWGDTAVARYPLGIFHMSGATTPIRPLESFKPPVRLRYEYFRNAKGEPREIARMPGTGPTWLSGVASVPDAEGKERLVATYSKIKAPLTVYERGLCVWNEEARVFERRKVLWTAESGEEDRLVSSDGHPVRWTDGEGVDWLLFGDPFPRMRCKPTFEGWSDPTQWERLEAQSEVRKATGEGMVKPHRGSIAWNAFRKKWVAIFTEQGGDPSLLGEIWYAEAEQPTGPWAEAVKVVTHEDYSFYNPRLHPEWTPEGSPVLLFEGTYTRQFSGSTVATPRWDYNQVLYRLDLDDPALVGE